MARWRHAVELAMTDEEIDRLKALSRSRTEPASRVERAQMLLAYRENPSCFAVGQSLGVHHQTVQRCVERALAYGPLAALDDRPRSGKEPTITPEAKAWLVSLACDKAKEHGYPHELWTTRLLAHHAREHGPAAGHACLARLVQGTVCKILGQEDIKPHKVRYYLERRDADFEQKMAEVLCVYREVQILKKAAARSKNKSKKFAHAGHQSARGPKWPPNSSANTSTLYGAVSPKDGTCVYLIMPTSNTACFQVFLDVLARKFARQDILLVLDGAPNHRCGHLVAPNNVTLLYLPPYSPELNPKENLWDEIREKSSRTTHSNP